MGKIDRYIENIGACGITKEAQEKIINSKVIIMGCGGLGSAVVMNLSALGVGQIKLIDNGIVEESNLNCQIIHKYKNIGRAKVISAKDWIQEFNSDIKVEIAKVQLDELNYFNIVAGYDIIVDCFNTTEGKYMLNEIALRHNKVLIHGAHQGYYGQVTTIIPPQSGCLNCVSPKPKTVKEENYASLSSVVSIIGSMQAQEVLKVITGIGQPLVNKMLIYDGIKGQFKEVEYFKNIACEACCEKEFN